MLESIFVDDTNIRRISSRAVPESPQHYTAKMSRPNSSLQRDLTLTEELERLEQSITLTLQGK